MRLIGLTGTVAAGKSTVARLFAGWGARVIDADGIVRALQQPGTAVFDAIVARFGTRVLRPDGTIDRAALRAIALTDDVARADLERIVHPAVERRRRELVDTARRDEVRVVVAEVPLLFEATDPSAYDAIVVVDAPEAVRRARIRRTRGLDDPEIDALFRAQWDGAAKRARATVVIENDGDEEALVHRARTAWDRVTA